MGKLELTLNAMGMLTLNAMGMYTHNVVWVPTWKSWTFNELTPL